MNGRGGWTCDFGFAVEWSRIKWMRIHLVIVLSVLCDGEECKRRSCMRESCVTLLLSFGRNWRRIASRPSGSGGVGKAPLPSQIADLEVTH
jgi:hypothetical protein